MTQKDQQQLGKTLWGIADQLRGAMNADDFRDYMLSFLFLRYLSFNYEEAAKKELGKDYPVTKSNLAKEYGVSTPLQLWYESNLEEIEEFEKQIANLEHTLADTKSYYANLTSTGTLVNPVIKQQKSFEIYYLDKQGPYASIKGYLKELRSMFNDLPDNAVFLTIYMDAGYNPKNAKMRIGIMRHHDIQLKTGVTLPLVTIPEYRALIHKSHGPGALLSMLWQELNKYRINQRLSLNDHLPFT